MSAGFRPEVQSAIDGAIASSRDVERPIAVFDFDNTCIVGDIGELFSYYLLDEMLYRWDLDAFWDLIDERDGRETIRALVDGLLMLDDAAREASELWPRYRAELGSVYQRKLLRDGKRACYSWAVRLHVGISELDMTTFSQRAVAAELARPLGVEHLNTERGENLSVRRGARFLVEMHGLMNELRRAGIEVWIVSATNWWTVASFARLFGISPDRVIGNRVNVSDGVLTDALVEPALFKEGKVAAIEREIGVRPMIVAGDSETDLSMLELASHLPLVIDAGSKEFVEHAAASGWVIQPQAELSAVARLEK